MFTSVGILHYFFLACLDISKFTVCVLLKPQYYWILNCRNDSAGLLIGSWATKATPVLCIHFTRKNLMIASGPAALQEDKSPHKTWTTPPLQKSPSGQCWRVGCQQCCRHYLMEQWQISSVLELEDYISNTVMNAYTSSSPGGCWWLQISLFKMGLDLAEDWAVPLIYMPAGLCGKEQGVYHG